MASIREVAQLSGVSVATVSRVLNGTATVREETRQRVLEQIRELDYVPSAAARTLVRRRSQVIGVVVNTGDAHPDLRHPFFGDVLAGLKQALGASHYDLLLFTGRQGFLRRALHHQLDGLVLMGVDRRDPDLRGVLERGLPAMNVDLDVHGARAGYVMSDNVGGARLATRHLIELGHVRIATIAGLANTKPATDRLRGYREELLAHRLPTRVTYVRHGDFYSSTGHEQAHRLLALRHPPTAIFAASDEMAIGAVSAIHEAGLSVPGDVSVVGFDDIESAALLRPPLTTIRQNKTALGRVAGESLVRLIVDERAKPPRVALPVELVARKSSGAAG
ncbi:MAG TPA: LacI family DNA-binding transcriptional regulator [Gaiellaceae bacterium]|nr:LacI family DNA-binding transcriptional regulator [Gaiellaceae bacterium]